VREKERVPARAQEDGLDARAGCQLAHAGLKVALQQVHAQAVLRVRRMHKVQDLLEVVLAREEEGQDAAQACAWGSIIACMGAMLFSSAHSAYLRRDYCHSTEQADRHTGRP
jgi:hypothetical protein